MNRAQRRSNGRHVKAIQRQAKRRARRLPRCPLCKNEITDSDRAKSDDGATVHRSCAERLHEAQKLAATQRLSQSGFWLPGMDE